MGLQIWNQRQLFSHDIGNGCATSVIARNIHSQQERSDEEDRGTNSGKNTVASGISTLCKEGRLKEALQVLDIIDQQVIHAHPKIYGALLHGCGKMKALSDGKRVHAHMMRAGFKPDIHLGNSLVTMYAKCGSIPEARQVFEQMVEKDVVTWTSITFGLIQLGHYDEAFELFLQMQKEGVKPDKVCFLNVLNACTGPAFLDRGKQIHSQILEVGLEGDTAVANALVSMYARCWCVKSAVQIFDKMEERDVVSWTSLVSLYCKLGKLAEAQQLFAKIPSRDVISWTAMIAGYVHQGCTEEAYALFCKMQQEGVKPDKVTLLSVLGACTNPKTLQRGKEIHALITKAGFESDVRLGNALISMYAKCGSIPCARQVFDKMPEKDIISWTAVMNLYCKCGSVLEAHQIFARMPKRDVVAWNAMISGYARLKRGEKALELFHQMERENAVPDSVTFTSALNACASIASLEKGKEIHSQVVKAGFGTYSFVQNALVDMYTKCRKLATARELFDRIVDRDVVTWNAMILGYAQNKQGKEALVLYERMVTEGVKPDRVTFIAVLLACRNEGLMEDRRRYFTSMRQDHGIKPTWQHYNLLSRPVDLDKSHHLLRSKAITDDDQAAVVLAV